MRKIELTREQREELEDAARNLVGRSWEERQQFYADAKLLLEITDAKKLGLTASEIEEYARDITSVVEARVRELEGVGSA